MIDLIIRFAGILVMVYGGLYLAQLLWKKYKLFRSPPSEIEEFLKKECPAGEYLMLSLFINKEQAQNLLEHIDKFRGRTAAVGNETGEGVLLGMNNALKSVENEDLDKSE